MKTKNRLNGYNGYQLELPECAHENARDMSYGTDGSHAHLKIEWHEITLGPTEEC